MPRGDRTGPAGEGPLTGRRMGFCAGYDHPGYMNQGRGFGRGLGRGYGHRFRGGYGYGGGYGWGYRHGSGPYYDWTISRESEKSMIESEIRILKEQLSALEERLAGLDKEEKK